MKKYFLLAILFIFFSSAFGQGIFRRGFIVSNNGDTIQCEIAADLLVELKERIRVRHKNNNELIVYTPDKLRAFYFDLNNVFESVTIEGKGYLLRRLVMGYFSLYSFPRTPSSPCYYLKKNDGTFVMLVNTITPVQVGDRNYKKQGYEYVASLKVAMKDRPELAKYIDRARMEDGSLADIVKRYNNVSDPKAEPAKISEKGKPRLDFGALVGFSKYAYSAESKAGVRAGILATLRSTKDRAFIHYNLGLFYNKADYESTKSGQYTLEAPIYISFYPKETAKVAAFMNVGFMPSYYSGYYSYSGEPYSEFSVPFLVGTGADIRLKKNYLKVDLSVSRGFISLSLGYMF